MSDAITRKESLLKSIADGTSSSLKPITREEQYLAYIAGETNSFPLEPITREEAFLDKIAKSGGGGGGSSINVQPLTVTENGTWDAPEGQAYDPVTVDVKAVTEPITITENGVYPVPKGAGVLKFGTDWKFKDVITVEDFEAVLSHYFDSAAESEKTVGVAFNESKNEGFTIQKMVYPNEMGTLYMLLYLEKGTTAPPVTFINASLLTGAAKEQFPAEMMWCDNDGIPLDAAPTIPNMSEDVFVYYIDGTDDASFNPEYFAPLFDIETKSLDGWGEITVNVAGGGGAELNIAYGDTAPEDTSKLWVKTSKPSKVKVASKLNIVERDDSAVITLGVKHRQDYIYPGAQVGNKVWMPGGYTTRYTNEIYYFDLETETKVLAGATLPRTTAFAGICAIGTSVYVIGGKDPDVREFLPVVRVIDTVTDTVSTLSMRLPSNATDIRAVAYGDKIYMFGIYNDDSQYTNTIWCFDTETETLTTLSAALPFNYLPSAVVMYEDSAFLFNGYDGSKARNEVVKFDFLAETATLLTVKTPFSATVFTTFNYKGQIYLTYGTDIYLFDTTKEMFTKLSLKLPAAKNGAVIGITDEAIYLLCGSDNNWNSQMDIYKLLIGAVIDLPADTLQLLSTLDRNKFNLINTDTAQVEIGMVKAYKGNADGVGVMVEAALHNGTSWVTI